jgi:superfamily I DNA/RNA helicase
MWVSTFHSLCARLLRREAPAIGLSRDFVIYDSSDQLTVVKQALKRCTSTTASCSRARRCRASAARRTGWKARRDGRAAGWNRATSRSRRSTPTT